MSVDERIREGLLITNSRLPEADTVRALEAVTSRTRTASQRRRWLAVGTVAAVAAAVAAAVVLAPGTGGDRSPSPAGPATPSPSLDQDAARVIAQGNLVSYGVGASGSLLTVWTTCEDEDEPPCPYAWRIGTGTEPQSQGLVGPRRSWFHPEVYPVGAGFLLQADNEPAGTFVTFDGTATPIRDECLEEDWPSGVQPGTHVVVRSSLLSPWIVDTVTGTSCLSPYLAHGGEPGPIDAGEYADDGTLWATIGGAVGWYDGLRWRFHDLPTVSEQGGSALAVAGSRVAALQWADDGSVVTGLSVTTDAGATWSVAGDQDLPFEDLPLFGLDSMAFAGTSALMVVDGQGVVWRSTDEAAFSRVETPGRVSGLEPAPDAVIAQLDHGDRLVRISADGTVEPVIAR